MQPLLRARTAAGTVGRKTEAFPERSSAEVFAQPLVPLRVFTGAPLQQTVTLLWVFKLPWQWAEADMVSPWIAQFAFGFFSVMLTSTVLGFVTMVLFRPRSWCVYCPMGTMTQGICILKHGKEVAAHGRKSKEDRGVAEAAVK